MKQRLLVLEAHTPWIWSLFNVLPNDWTADRCGPVTAGLSISRWRDAAKDGHVPVFGWTRLFKLSTAQLQRRVAKQIAIHPPRAIVHTIPWTAGIVDRFADIAHVYRPHDCFGMYSWNQTRVRELEELLMTKCRVALPISHLQAQDFQQLGNAPVEVLPNGVSHEFVDRLRGLRQQRPADLPGSQGPTVGCIGQITDSYDATLMGEVADRLPDVQFIYIGPMQTSGFDSVMARPNVTWLGPRPHQDLPNYLREFSVCFSPLKINANNNRRSLLRLYDYLATDKPVISTAIDCAVRHRPHVDSIASAAEFVDVYRRHEVNHFAIDQNLRRSYVDQQTWNRRAIDFIRFVTEYCS